MRSHTSWFRVAAVAVVLLAPLTAAAGVDDASCPTAVTQLQPAPLVVSERTLRDAHRPARALGVLAGFDIVLVPGAGLAANAGALAAFERAAAQWEALISDPIVVTIDADFADLGNPAIIGQASSVLLQGPFDLVRDAVVADADPDDDVVAAMPTAAQFSASLPPGFALSGFLLGTKANLKALGFAGLDESFGVSDATITFNETFAFDLDGSDGVDPGTIDLETVAVHEIGHALGFFSIVDGIDGAVGGEVTPSTLDLYRFRARGANPGSASRFTRSRRSAVPGADEIFDDVESESRLSTGIFGGDGRQASHWKDDVLTGTFIGVMDPTLAAATIEPITAADRRAFDLVGYDIVTPSLCGSAPEPAASCFLQAEPLGASLLVDDRAAASRDQVQWTWGKGGATALADFLSPASSATRFELCVYDASGDAQPLQSAAVQGGAICGSRSCWRAMGSTGWSYARSASAGVGDGIVQLKLQSGADGRAQVIVKGKGASLAAPDPALTLPVTVQLVASDGASSRCWQTTFAGTPTRNDDAQFKAIGP